MYLVLNFHIVQKYCMMDSIMAMADLQDGSQHPSNDLPFLAHIRETADNTE